MENVNLGSGIGSGLDLADLGGSSEGGPMIAVTALDATRTGTEAEELAKKLRSRVALHIDHPALAAAGIHQ